MFILPCSISKGLWWPLLWHRSQIFTCQSPSSEHNLRPPQRISIHSSRTFRHCHSPPTTVTTNLINTLIITSTSPSPIGPPKPKDTSFVHTAAVRALRGDYEHYLGQKGFPMFVKLPYYSYEGLMSMLDWMHGLKILHEWTMKIIVGPLGDKKSSALQYRSKADTKARRQLKQGNIFPDLWEDAPQYLSPRKTSLLRGNFYHPYPKSCI